MPPWRDCTDEIKIIACAIALRAAGTVYGMHVRLGRDIEAKARAKGTGCLDFIRRRVAFYLDREFGRRVDFWFVLEDSDHGTAGGLHFHGQIGVEPSDRRRARNALKAAAGRWSNPKGRQFQVDMRPQNRDPDLWGAAYCGKSLAHRRVQSFLEARFGGQTTTLPRLTFNGATLTMTQLLGKQAQTSLSELAPQLD